MVDFKARLLKARRMGLTAAFIAEIAKRTSDGEVAFYAMEPSDERFEYLKQTLPNCIVEEQQQGYKIRAINRREDV